VGAVIAGPLGAAAGESPLHFTIWLLLLFSRRDSNPSNGLALALALAIDSAAGAGMKSGAACVAASASVGSAVADKVYTGTTETVQTLSNLLPFKGGGKRSS